MDMSSRVEGVENAMTKIDQAQEQMLVNFTQLSANVGSEKAKLVEDLKGEFDLHSQALNTIVLGAKVEFDSLKEGLQNVAGVSDKVFAEHSNAFGEVRQKVLDIEAKIVGLASSHSEGGGGNL